MADPLDFVDGLTSLADVSKPEFVAEMKALPRVFANAAAVRTYDLSTRTRIIVGDNLYKLDTESVEEDDGDSVIIDDGGNHWVKIENGGSGTSTLTQRVVTGPGDVTVDADDDDIIIIQKASGAATQVTLPSAADRTKPVRIVDGKGDAATNNITIAPESGETILAMTDYHYIIDSNGASITLTPLEDGTGWF
jgi:hypothetical protein